MSFLRAVVLSSKPGLPKRAFSTSKIRCNAKQSQVTASSGLPKPRLDYRAISENVLYKSHNAFNRKSPTPVGAVQNVARLYDEHKQLSTTLNAKRHARSTIGDKIRDTEGEEKRLALSEAKSLKEEIASIEERLSNIDDEMYSLALSIPNDTHPDVPIGVEPTTVDWCGLDVNPTPDANPLHDHVRIARELNMIDLEAGALVAGSSWYYLVNQGALLEMALANYALSMAMREGYRPIATPDVVKADLAMRCGFQPRDEGNVQQMYHLQNGSPGQPELVLSGTAEIPLAGLLANKVFDEEQLPLRMVGIGKAFRAEAGARGADTRGLYRVHQFTKVELFAVCMQDKSNEMMNDMARLQIKMFLGLGLPLRILDMPTTELGASAYRKYDIEAWMPGRGSWGEISSLSNCTDYQARRLHIRYRPHPPSDSPQDGGPLPFAHTLNGTAAAIPRLIVALLENGAKLDKDGNIIGLRLPSTLRPFWTGFPEQWIEWLSPFDTEEIDYGELPRLRSSAH